MKINTEDHILIRKTIAGDHRAFSELINRYKDLVYTLCVRMIRGGDAEEVAQDVFLKIYHSLPHFKGESKLSTWIYQITYRKCLDRIKKLKREQPFNVDEKFGSTRVEILENGFDQLAYEEQKECIENCINRLSEDDSALITLFYYKELPLDEIATILNITPNNAKVKLHRARQKLATFIEMHVAPEILEGYAKRST